MGGVACWKEIIDQRNALVQVLDCMAETIRISGKDDSYPTEAEEDDFIAKANDLAAVASAIQSRLAGTWPR